MKLSYVRTVYHVENYSHTHKIQPTVPLQNLFSFRGMYAISLIYAHRQEKCISDLFSRCDLIMEDSLSLPSSLYRLFFAMGEGHGLQT
jgi:hypothetical protein